MSEIGIGRGQQVTSTGNNEGNKMTTKSSRNCYLTSTGNNEGNKVTTKKQEIRNCYRRITLTSKENVGILRKTSLKLRLT